MTSVLSNASKVLDVCTYSKTAPCALVVDLKALQQNYDYLKSLTGAAKVAAVVKANAYGLGASQVSLALYEKGCRTFFVATLSEGIDLRQTLSPTAEIYVFQGYEKGLEELFETYHLKPVLIDLDSTRSFLSYCEKSKTYLKAALHFDSGMSRTGITDYDFKEIIELCAKNPLALKHIDLIFSHLACADQKNHLFNWQQLHKFSFIRSFFPTIRASFASSGGTFIHQAFHFEMVRTGVGLYGMQPQKGQLNGIEPVVRLYAKVCQVQEVIPQQTVGYGQTYKASKPCKIATLSIGYADGLPWGAKDVYVTFNGFKASVVGRISMDLITVDVTDVPEYLCFTGTFALVMGKEGLTVEQWAQKSNTIAYEILVKLGQRFERIYL